MREEPQKTTKGRLRALLTAILAASLSFAAPSAIALVAAPDVVGHQAPGGGGDQPFLMRPIAASPRLALRPGRATPDGPARDLAAILAPVVSLAAPVAAAAPAPRVVQRATASVPVTSRSSRGPPSA